MTGIGLEMFVAKKKKKTTAILNVMFFAVAIVVIVLIYRGAGVVAFYPAPFIVFLAYLGARYNTMMANVEYEYSLSTGVFNVDRIISQKIRKPLLNVQVSDITDFGRVSDSDAEAKSKKVKKIIFCSSGQDDDESSYYIVCDYQHKGPHMFIIEPDERFLRTFAAINPMIKRSLGRQF